MEFTLALSLLSGEARPALGVCLSLYFCISLIPNEHVGKQVLLSNVTDVCNAS